MKASNKMNLANFWCFPIELSQCKAHLPLAMGSSRGSFMYSDCTCRLVEYQETPLGHSEVLAPALSGIRKEYWKIKYFLLKALRPAGDLKLRLKEYTGLSAARYLEAYQIGESLNDPKTTTRVIPVDSISDRDT